MSNQNESSGNYQNRNRGGGNRDSNRRRYYSQPRVCQFCTDPNLKIDYKLVDLLRRFIFEGGKIRPRRQTGTCAKHQRAVAQAVKRARHIALMPFTEEALR